MARQWNVKGISKFEAEDSTVFTRGPHEIEYAPGKVGKYDYMLEDKNGVDYCTIEQMKSWNVELYRVLN